MADDVVNPFDMASQATQNLPGSQSFEDIRNQWASFLDQPGARTFLLQTGLSLMTPQWGTPASQVAGAIGQGAAAVSRGEALQSKEEAERARAEAAGTRAELAAQRIPLAHYQRQSIEQGQAATNIRGAHAAFQRNQNALYNQYKTDYAEWQKLQRDVMAKPEQKAAAPEPKDPRKDPGFNDFSAWLRSPHGAHWATLPGVAQFAAPRQQTASRPQQQQSSEDETE